MKVHIGPYKDDDTPRKEEVHIHEYDTWNMDHTLALIALPMLKQLKETKHGVPYMDYEDMPEHLQYIRREWDPRAVGDLFNGTGYNDDEFQRQQECWDWMMGEMIWAMEQVIQSDDSQFYDHSEVDENDSLEESVHKLKVDTEGLKLYNDRIVNGLKLFGKYYQSLWD